MELAYRNLYTEQEMPDIKRRKKVLTVLLHIALWVVFLSLPAIFKPRHDGEGLISTMLYDMLEPPRWTNALLLISVFYFNYYFAIPLLYMRRRYGLLVLSVIISFVVFYFLNSLQTPHHMMGHEHHEMQEHRHHHRFTAFGNSFNLFMFLIVYASSFAVCLYEQWQQTKEQMLNAEVSFLKAQINPHFLFNTLNSIYSLTLTKSDMAPDAILILAGMMRYSVSSASQSFVSLDREIGYISNYIELQKLRITDKVKISYEVEGQALGNQIAPFLLIPFVENAFKYGVNSEEDSNIRINVSIKGSELSLKVCNNKVFIRKDKDNSTGLGVNTTRKRLDLVYPGKYNLVIEDNAADYNVSLQISLK